MSVYTFEIHQAWQGYVLSVSDDVFAAHLVAVTGNMAEQYAEIYTACVDPSEYHLLREGAVFEWSIGVLRDGRRMVQDHSVLHFRGEVLPMNKEAAEKLAREWEALFE